MAFEDAVVFCRKAAQYKAGRADAFLRDFERCRLDRVRQVSETEWDNAERSYKESRPIGPSDDYKAFLRKGV